MRELDLEAVPMIGVVNRRCGTMNRLFAGQGTRGRTSLFGSHQRILRLIQMIRDETTATRYLSPQRRELRDFTSLNCPAIPGVGEKRKTRLLRQFGSIQKIATAKVDELAPLWAGHGAEIVDHFGAPARAGRSATGVSVVKR